MSRYWTHNPQRKVESKAHGPAYSRDGGKVLNDTETQPPYPANIGPDGPNLNKVGFETVKAFVKARFMELPHAGSNAYDKWDAPGGFGGPAVQETDYAGMAKGAGEALSKAGGAMQDAENAKNRSIPDSGGGVGGSAPVETRFTGHVLRRDRGER